MAKSKKKIVKKKPKAKKIFKVKDVITNLSEDTYRGAVRIEGKVTSEKLRLAEEFEEVFKATVDEVMSLSVYNPAPELLSFVKGSGITSEKIEEIKGAPAWTVFDINGTFVLKTQDNKLEDIRAYSYRLERAVLHQVALVNREREDKNKILERLIEARAHSQVLESSNLVSMALIIQKAYDNVKSFVTNLFKGASNGQ